MYGYNAFGTHTLTQINYQTCSPLFEKAYHKGWSVKLWGFLIGQKNILLGLHTVANSSKIKNQRIIGSCTVQLDKITGTESRTKDFDRQFRPLNRNNRDRWLSVAVARIRGIPLPPVELIQVGESYFVRDGHHRISVAKTLGEVYIEASVTVWDMN